MNRYDDIINLKRPTSKIHKPMSLQARAAQFAPFQALTGYNEAIKEASRLTQKQIIIDDNQKELLNAKLKYLLSQIKNKPEVTLTSFVQDQNKPGGTYQTITNKINKIDLYNGQIILIDNTKIPIKNIINITNT